MLYALHREEVLRCMRAIAEPLRFRILELLAESPGPRTGPFDAGEPGLCLSDLETRMGRPHALVSHHVRVLHDAGLVRRIRRGRWALIQLDLGRLADLGRNIAGFGPLMPSAPVQAA